MLKETCTEIRAKTTKKISYYCDLLLTRLDHFVELIIWDNKCRRVKAYFQKHFVESELKMPLNKICWTDLCLELKI